MISMVTFVFSSVLLIYEITPATATGKQSVPNSRTTLAPNDIGPESQRTAANKSTTTDARDVQSATIRANSHHQNKQQGSIFPDP